MTTLGHNSCSTAPPPRSGGMEGVARGSMGGGRAARPEPVVTSLNIILASTAPAGAKELFVHSELLLPLQRRTEEGCQNSCLRVPPNAASPVAPSHRPLGRIRKDPQS
jgi:hypothetical protein